MKKRKQRITIGDLELIRHCISITRSDYPDTDKESIHFNENHVKIHKELDDLEDKLISIFNRIPAKGI